MRYVNEFRDGRLARAVAAAIAAEIEPGRRYNFMEFCGGHTHAIYRYGVEDLLPDNVRMIHGPGCPVCVLPTGRIDCAIALARRPDVILCSYADMLRVPGSKRMSLLKAKADGADVRMVYSTADALDIAADNPERTVVFFAIGFETTTPATALALREARRRELTNFKVFCNHVVTPAAMRSILDSRQESDAAAVPIDGFIGPGHVSVVIGTLPYEVFELRPSFEWRGLGRLPASALRIAPAYADFDAERSFALPQGSAAEAKSCECAAIVRGLKQPIECKLFDNGCTPEHPIGACMVSSEGACAAHYTYGRFRDTRRSA